MKRMKRKKQKKSGSGICKQTALRKSLLIGKKNLDAWLGLGLVLRLSYPNNDSSPYTNPQSAPNPCINPKMDHDHPYGHPLERTIINSQPIFHIPHIQRS